MPDRDGRMHLLILGGTGEAAVLAQAALARFGDGLGDLRIGGFGGADGLAAYIAEAGVDLVIDATHPFAAQISAQARAACATAGVKRLLLERPVWVRDPRDRWIEVDDLAAAAAALPLLGRRCFLTIGARDLGAFAARSGLCWSAMASKCSCARRAAGARPRRSWSRRASAGCRW